MRNAKYLVALLFIVCSLTACKKYLVEEVFSSSQSTNFYMNEQQGISALNGVYAGLRDTYFTYANDYTFFSMLDKIHVPDLKLCQISFIMKFNRY